MYNEENVSLSDARKILRFMQALCDAVAERIDAVLEDPHDLDEWVRLADAMISLDSETRNSPWFQGRCWDMGLTEEKKDELDRRHYGKGFGELTNGDVLQALVGEELFNEFREAACVTDEEGSDLGEQVAEVQNLLSLLEPEVKRGEGGYL